MDDEANQLLRDILSQQTKQTELLQKYLPPLWTKIRFSLLTLLLLMTGVAIGLGVLVYEGKRPASSRPAPIPTYQIVPPMRGNPAPAVLPESTPRRTVG
jgi:hypothetical protein